MPLFYLIIQVKEPTNTVAVQQFGEKSPPFREIACVSVFMAHRNYINQDTSKCRPCSSNISVTWKPVTNENSKGPPLGLLTCLYCIWGPE